LSEKALGLESRDRSRYLRVIGIDTTKPENFRIAAKKSPAKSEKQKPSKQTVTPLKRVPVAKKAVTKVSMGPVDAVVSSRQGIDEK
jgi:hypothetical protein